MSRPSILRTGKVSLISTTVYDRNMVPEGEDTCSQCSSEEKRYGYSDNGPLFYAYARRVILPDPDFTIQQQLTMIDRLFLGLSLPANLRLCRRR